MVVDVAAAHKDDERLGRGAVALLSAQLSGPYKVHGADGQQSRSREG